MFISGIEGLAITMLKFSLFSMKSSPIIFICTERTSLSTPVKFNTPVAEATV